MTCPFNSTNERECNKKKAASNVPGPGTYIDINNPMHSSVCKPLLKFSSDRSFAEAHGIKIGAFGSNSLRFTDKAFKPKDTPGPGHYEGANKNDCISMFVEGSAPIKEG